MSEPGNPTATEGETRMDPNRNTPERRREPASGSLAEALILDSRRDALASLRTAILRKTGPVLLTGEAGSGKTWLWHHLATEFAPHWRWIGVDLSPADSPVDLYRLIAHALGISCGDGHGESRTALAGFLQDRAAEGEEWGLIVDEAQSVSRELLEEVRILANRLGAVDGFSALVLVGHTSLARRIVAPIHEPLAVRLVDHIHLRPLDVDETVRFLRGAFAGDSADLGTLERLHRDAAGNPKRLLNLAGRQRSSGLRSITPPPQAAIIAPVQRAEAPTPNLSNEDDLRPGPVLAPDKPPLYVDEGLIEVGWEPTSDLDADLDETSEAIEPLPLSGAAQPAEPPSVEAIDDRYAALQAWTEWARNQGRSPSGDSPFAYGHDTPLGSALDHGPGHGGSSAGIMGSPAFWTDQEHGFAPYSQLFSRLKPTKDKT